MNVYTLKNPETTSEIKPGMSDALAKAFGSERKPALTTFLSYTHSKYECREACNCRATEDRKLELLNVMY